MSACQGFVIGCLVINVAAQHRHSRELANGVKILSELAHNGYVRVTHSGLWSLQFRVLHSHSNLVLYKAARQKLTVSRTVTKIDMTMNWQEL